MVLLIKVETYYFCTVEFGQLAVKAASGIFDKA
jgi:hypothetical protein